MRPWRNHVVEHGARAGPCRSRRRTRWAGWRPGRRTRTGPRGARAARPAATRTAPPCWRRRRRARAGAGRRSPTTARRRWRPSARWGTRAGEHALHADHVGLEHAPATRRCSVSTSGLQRRRARPRRRRRSIDAELGHGFGHDAGAPLRVADVGRHREPAAGLGHDLGQPIGPARRQPPPRPRRRPRPGRTPGRRPPRRRPPAPCARRAASWRHSALARGGGPTLDQLAGEHLADLVAGQRVDAPRSRAGTL